MSAPLPPIEEILDEAHAWTVDGPDVFLAFVTDAYGTTTHYYIPRDVLASCHPDFPDAIEASVEWHAAFDEDHVKGNLIINTLECLNNPPISIYDGKQSAEFMKVVSIDIPHHFPEYVQISGIVVRSYSGGAEHRAVPFLTQSYRDRLNYDREAINRIYPGWEQRWMIGKELRMQMNELVRHVFHKAPEVDNALSSDISFD